MSVRIVGLSLLVAASALAGPTSKVDICHFDEDTGLFHVISIDGRAVNAHLTNHGDANPATWYPDGDGDGYGDPAGTTDRCPQTGLVDNGTDCDETDAAVNPGAAEVAYDGIDNDCNTGSRDDDLDYDGFGRDADCNDGDANISPDAAELVYDGIDNDCDAATPDDDLDGDGFLVGEDCNDENAGVSPVASEVCEDNMDNDCSGDIDEGCAVVSECPCFTSELILEEIAELHAGGWQGTWSNCNVYERNEPGGTYSYTDISAGGSTWDPQYVREDDRFYSVYLDDSAFMPYCYGSSTQFTSRWVNGYPTSSSTMDFYSRKLLTNEEHVACEALLVDTAAMLGMTCQ